MTKQIIIEQFIDSNKHEAIQGSEQWLKDRRFVIGGSEIATIAEQNCYSTIDILVAQKVGFDKFSGNNATRWGNLFEGASELFFKTLFSADIYSTGSIPHKTITNHRYSPDGICLLSYDKNYKYKINSDKDERITLLEFKSPYSSVPARSVPKHYLPQVKAGLCTIDISEVGLFMTNMFRKCAIKQLNFSMSYDTTYHKDTELKLKKIDEPIANSIILISINKDKKNRLIDEAIEAMSNVTNGGNSSNIDYELFSDSDDSDADDSGKQYENHIYDNGTNILYKMYEKIQNFDNSMYNYDTDDLSQHMIDLGAQNDIMFNQFLELYKPEDTEGLFNITYVKPQLNKELIQKNAHNILVPDELKHVTAEDNLLKICKKYNYKKIINKFCKRCIANNEYPVAFLPWKLLRSSNVIVHKDETYLDDLKDKIDSVINIVKDIMNESDKIEKFAEYFPDNPIARQHLNSKVTADILNEFIDSDDSDDNIKDVVK